MANPFGQRPPQVSPNSVVGAPKILRTELTPAPQTGLDAKQAWVKAQVLRAAEVALA
jgi:hypothetical protein